MQKKNFKVSFKFLMIPNQEVMLSVKYCIQLCFLWLLYRPLPKEFPVYLFNIVFFIFSILYTFFLQSFTTKEKQILITFFHHQGHNFSIVLLPIPKLI